MNPLHESMKQTFADALELSVRKNHDYAGDADPFKNFRVVEVLGLCSVEKGIAVRLCDKLSRIATGLGNELKVKDESLIDTLNDVINYAAILKAYIEIKK